MGYKVWADEDVLTAGDVNSYLMRQTVIVCTSGTRPSTPAEGLTIYETDTDLLRVYSGSGWETFAGVARATVTDAQTGQYTVIATTYGVTTSGGTYADCGVAFVAPWSGRVIVMTNATLSSSGALDVYVSPVVRTGGTVGSGSVVAASADSASVRSSTTALARSGVSQLVTGLTPGSTYNVRLDHRVGAGTGTISSRSVIANPTT